MRVIARARGAPLSRAALLLATADGALPVAITVLDLGVLVAAAFGVVLVVGFFAMMAESFPSTTRSEYDSIRGVNGWSLARLRHVPRAGLGTWIGYRRPSAAFYRSFSPPQGAGEGSCYWILVTRGRPPNVNAPPVSSSYRVVPAPGV